MILPMVVTLVLRKRWDRWHSPSPNWQYIALIYHLYIAFWGVKNATDPTFYGNQKEPLILVDDDGWWWGGWCLLLVMLIMLIIRIDIVLMEENPVKQMMLICVYIYTEVIPISSNIACFEEGLMCLQWYCPSLSIKETTKILHIWHVLGPA